MGDRGRTFTYSPTYNLFVYQYIWKKIFPVTGHLDAFKELFFVVY